MKVLAIGLVAVLAACSQDAPAATPKPFECDLAGVPYDQFVTAMLDEGLRYEMETNHTGTGDHRKREWLYNRDTSELVAQTEGVWVDSMYYMRQNHRGDDAVLTDEWRPAPDFGVPARVPPCLDPATVDFGALDSGGEEIPHYTEADDRDTHHFWVDRQSGYTVRVLRISHYLDGDLEWHGEFLNYGEPNAVEVPPVAEPLGAFDAPSQ